MVKRTSIRIGSFSFLAGIAFLFLLVPDTLLALELDYPLLPPNPSAPVFIAWLYKFALGSVGALGVLTIAWGGIRYITSRGNASLQSDAKEWIWNAVLGIALLTGSFLILFTINPNLVTLGVAPFDLDDARGNDLYRSQISTLAATTFAASPNPLMEAAASLGCFPRTLSNSSLSCIYFDPVGFGVRVPRPHCPGQICVLYPQNSFNYYRFCCPE